MNLTDEQRKQISLSIKVMDKLRPDCDLLFAKYDEAKLKCGFATFISGLLLIGVLSGNYEIQESIGTLGVGALPVVLIGATAYFFSIKKRYDQKIAEYIEAQIPLLSLGIGYTPIDRHTNNRRLQVINTKEELNTSDFE